MLTPFIDSDSITINAAEQGETGERKPTKKMNHCVKHFVARDSLRNTPRAELEAGPNQHLAIKSHKKARDQDLIFPIWKARRQNINWPRDRIRSKKPTFSPSCF